LIPTNPTLAFRQSQEKTKLPPQREKEKKPFHEESPSKHKSKSALHLHGPQNILSISYINKQIGQGPLLCFAGADW
jgi:hypothetical protein